VSERDFKGNLLWECSVPGQPLGVQRLPTGNTFVVLQHLLLEYDKDKKEVFRYQKAGSDFLRARKLRSGEIVTVSSKGMLTRLSAVRREEVQSFLVGPPNNLFGSFDVLPSGNVVVVQQQLNLVVEYSRDGKEVGRWSVPTPS